MALLSQHKIKNPNFHEKSKNSEIFVSYRKENITETCDTNRFSLQELKEDLEAFHQANLQWIQEEIFLLFGDSDNDTSRIVLTPEFALQMAFYLRKSMKEADFYQHKLARYALSLIETRFPEIYQLFNEKSSF